MTRTRLRQLEQIWNSNTYDDQLNQKDQTGASTEGQPGDSVNISSVVSTTAATNQIVLSGDYSADGYAANSDDEIVLSGTSCDDTYIIQTVSYNSPNTTFVVNPVGLGGTALTDNGSVGTGTFVVDSTKSLDRDLNHIRTQLRKLNRTEHWYDDPLSLPVDMFSVQTSTAVTAGTPIDVGGNYNAGNPYDLSVFLNGVILKPSEISGSSVVTEYDYQEVDENGDLVESGETGRKIIMNFDIYSGDIFQFVWND